MQDTNKGEISISNDQTYLALFYTDSPSLLELMTADDRKVRYWTFLVSIPAISSFMLHPSVRTELIAASHADRAGNYERQ